MMLCFVEQLTLSALLRMLQGRRPDRILVLYGSNRAGRWAAHLLHRSGWLPLPQELSFDFFDEVTVPNGRTALQEVFFHACPELLKRMEGRADVQAFLTGAARRPGHRDYLWAYLSKRLYWELVAGVRSILITQWKGRALAEDSRSAGLLLSIETSCLNDALRHYADSLGVRILFHRSSLLRRVARWAVELRERCGRLLYSLGRHHPAVTGATPRIAVEMYRQGLRRCTLYNTDLFWIGHASLPPQAAFAYFRHAADQPNAQRPELLRSAGIAWMDRNAVLQAMARGVGSAPEWSRRPVRGSPLAHYAADFYREYGRWVRFLVATGTKIHVSTSDQFPESEAMHAALADSGGLSASIQRSIEWDARVWRRSVVDVHFGFSRANAESEERSGSRIREFVVAGYLFDDAFPAARRFAQGLRERLLANGARFIVCFLDENEGVNPKTLGGSRITRSDYSFLLQRLEKDETLGLLLKPKREETLPQRLGPVWPKLEQMIRQGRCLLLQGEPHDRRYLPSAAAAAADVAVGILHGGTAGLESALVGTRTLLLSRKEDLGPFAALPQGAVVCDSWAQIWEAVERLRANPADPTIGNWEPILEGLVSFRDEQSARRIGQYIGWLFEAFRRGMTREEAVEHASDQYARAWGRQYLGSVPRQAWAGTQGTR